jgi:D-arabinose 1-dehydrogenase-like Zn-dependent alcohol dehydrogenase
MAVKFLKAFGCEVTVVSTSASKREEALNSLGADKFVISKNEDEVRRPCSSSGAAGFISWLFYVSFRVLCRRGGPWPSCFILPC